MREIFEPIVTVKSKALAHGSIREIVNCGIMIHLKDIKILQG